MAINLSATNPSEVDSQGFLDVRLDASTTHYLISTGIAMPELYDDS